MEGVEVTNDHPLFIFDLANNHCGDVDHGLRIIREAKEATRGFDFRFAFKFQYRDLDTFIHPDFKARTDLPYVKRFSDTRLSKGDFQLLKDELNRLGFISICTPFDEPSVSLLVEQSFQRVKIASCSFTDWPLLEAVAATDKPIIASTAGASLEEIDNVVTFFLHRDKHLTLMHCVGEYPTTRDRLQLNQIELLRRRYPDIPVGFSTHEEPDNTDSVKLAVAKGATVFERHVSVESDRYPVNAYSSTPAQTVNWLRAARDAWCMLGTENARHESSEKEQRDLLRFRRGVFAKTDLRPGQKLTADNVFFAFPCTDGQLIANAMSKYQVHTSRRELKAGEAVCLADVETSNSREKVLRIVRELKDVLLRSHIALPNRLELELSHHYGIDNYHANGAAILNCVNREYCKKLIILLPGQRHPLHHHLKKEETFQVLFGGMEVTLDGSTSTLKAGDLLTVERGAWHGFHSEKGCIFEEISTTHFVDDSLYEDDAVSRNPDRKTRITFWSDWLEKDIG